MATPDAQITREVRPQTEVVPPLDVARFKLADGEWAFLRIMMPGEDDDSIKKRVIDIQKEAYEHWPYPCIHGFHFVWLFMSRNEIYPEVVESGKKGNTLFLDIGLGSDVRKLVQDGYPATNVFGTDLNPEFLQLGHKLYRDAESCKIRFFASDLLALPLADSVAGGDGGGEITRLEQLRGKLTHVYTGALFHLFDESTQSAMALRIATLLKRQAGTIVFGRHQGLQEEGYIQDHMERKRYGHSPASWARMWKLVFAGLESPAFAENRVEVKAKLGDSVTLHLPGGDRTSRMLFWSVKIV